MNFLSFVGPDGRNTWGRLCGTQVVDLAGPSGFADLRAAIAADALANLGERNGSATYDVAEITYLPLIPNPDKILCVGINYGAHASETGREISPAPSMFARFADTLVAHGQPIRRPAVSTHLDFEGELAIIIGRGGRYIAVEEALSHVAGYTCFNDGSIRDYQKFSVTSGKNFPHTGALGPGLVTEGIDPSALTLETRLNGQVVQHASTSTLIHTVPEIIAFASRFTELTPGTVIATGTPEGVGSRRTPPLWMKRGDMIEVEISGIGTLTNRIEDEQSQ